MCDGLDHAPSRHRRQLSIRIQGDYIADWARQASRHPDFFPPLPGEQRIEVLKFPTFPLPSDPLPLTFGPDPLSMEEQKSPARIARVQLIDPVARRCEQCGISGGGGLRRIGEIGKQAEEEILFAV